MYTEVLLTQQFHTPMERVKDNGLDDSSVLGAERCLVPEEICSVFCKQRFYYHHLVLLQQRQTKGIFPSSVCDEEMKQIIEKLMGVNRRATNMIYSPEGTAFRGKMKETSLSA